MDEQGQRRLDRPREGTPAIASTRYRHLLGVPGAFAGAVMLATLSTLLWRPHPVLVWNASASSPVGLYAVVRTRELRVGDMAVAWAPDGARRLAAARRYLPLDVPLVKRVSAAAGARVCGAGSSVLINGRLAARRRVRDRLGRPMPWWPGCRILRPGEFFLLSPRTPDAFDGRYFGITSSNQIVGKASLLWPR
ncbi:MAG: S26 family signal peptidase [Bacillota bacterium]